LYQRIFLSLCIFSALQCRLFDNTLPVFPSDFNQMDLDQMQTGQTFHYLFLIGSGYPDPNDQQFYYTGDTLELKVLEFNSIGYYISESITPGSPVWNMDSTRYYGIQKDSVYVNLWIVRNDSLFIQSIHPEQYTHSHLLFRSDFALMHFTEAEVKMKGWKTTYPYNEADARLFATDYKLLGHTYPRLNVYINNSPMAGDGPGNTTIFSRPFGIIRTSSYSFWTGMGIGWDKL